MSMEDARKQLSVEDKDLASIRRTRDSNWFLLLLLGAITGVAAFVTGYAVGRETDSSYPYSSIGLASFTGVGRRRIPWVAVLLLAILAFFCFGFGTFAAHPIYGEGSYYGVFGRKT
jgi:hypothetical protein